MIVRSRVLLLNEHPVSMMVDAKKISDVEPFRTTPQQSDYVAAWSKNATGASGASGGAVKRWSSRIYRALPTRWRQNIKGRHQKIQSSFRNKDFYRRLF
jgi:hypothetical protein